MAQRHWQTPPLSHPYRHRPWSRSRGQYWDGGIIDDHFDLDQYEGDGLILYPHFRASIIPGWFDKLVPWGKIPDRSDFTGMGEADRIRYWEQCIAASAALAEEFDSLLHSSDPLAGVIVYSQFQVIWLSR